MVADKERHCSRSQTHFSIRDTSEDRNYASEYTKLKGGTYQELDLKRREEEHHYQRAN